MALETALFQIENNDSSLRGLNLGENTYNDDELKKLIAALKTNTSLKSLSLGGKLLTEDNITLLAKALNSNNSLQQLSLEKFVLTKKGAKAIINALQSNETLLSLKLRLDTFPSEAIKESFDEFLKINKTLQTFQLMSNVSFKPICDTFLFLERKQPLSLKKISFFKILDFLKEEKITKQDFQKKLTSDLQEKLEKFKSSDVSATPFEHNFR
jgi:hypothetical protein